jgi:predicted nucleotidyltransferase
MFGLTEHTIKAIQNILKAYPKVDKAVLYGSRAIGNYRKGSDIDLTLLGQDLDLTILHQIEDDIDDLLLPYKIDLSIYHQINNPEFLDHIFRIGKVFYERSIK